MLQRRPLILSVSLLAALVALAVVWIATRGQETPPPPPKPERPAAAAPSIPPGVPRDVVQLLREGRNWRAARRLRDRVGPDSPPEMILFAARAEAGWEGWDNVADLLEGKPWLDRVSGGDGWYLLGRAREAAGKWDPAAEAYGRYVAVSRGEVQNAGRHSVAELRLGLALLRAGKVQAGVDTLAHMRRHAPAAAGWVSVLAAEALVEKGDTARIRNLLATSEAPSPLRAQRARVKAHRAARDEHGARALAIAFRERAGTPAARGEMGVFAARSALALGDTAAARADLRAAVAQGNAQAAELLAKVGGLGAGDRLAIARVRDRSGDNARAAAGYRVFLAGSGGTTAERRAIRMSLGRALFDSGKFAEAEAALRPLADAMPEAGYLLGRAQYRRGARGAAEATFLRVATRFRGSAPAADALFLVADLAHDAGNTARARALYRRVVAEAPRTERARLAAMRLAGLAFLRKDYASAARLMEEQRSRSTGAAWAQATYWAGRAHARRGERGRAEALFREVRAREPVSYYAVQAAKRLDEEPWPLRLAPAPAADSAAGARAEASLYAADQHRAAGLQREAEAEVDRLVAAAETDPGTLYPLAEALNPRGFTVRAVRIGLALRKRGEPYNLRLLRILYPFPYRELIAAEASDRKLDPFLVAALTRQESTFKASISSPVGARGLMQIMPETGRQLAYGADIKQWSPDLLFNPEINVHLGTRYLADQMRAYRGSLPSVFSAYNAGPRRITRWRKFPEAADSELFTERIPYEETRDYVKILTRNIALYRGLYGDTAASGPRLAEQ